MLCVGEENIAELSTLESNDTLVRLLYGGEASIALDKDVWLRDGKYCLEYATNACCHDFP